LNDCVHDGFPSDVIDRDDLSHPDLIPTNE
jgi:hypothetical protein